MAETNKDIRKDDAKEEKDMKDPELDALLKQLGSNPWTAPPPPQVATQPPALTQAQPSQDPGPGIAGLNNILNQQQSSSPISIVPPAAAPSAAAPSSAPQQVPSPIATPYDTGVDKLNNILYPQKQQVPGDLPKADALPQAVPPSPMLNGLSLSNPALEAGAGSPPPRDKNGNPIPLGPQGLLNSQINRLEQNKYLTSQEAINQSQGYRQSADEQNEFTAAAEKRQAEFDAGHQRRMNDVDTSVKRQRLAIQQAMTETVDPQRLWKNKGTGDRVEASLGIMLGGIGGGMMKTGRNPGLEAFNRSVDLDIASQQEHIDNVWKGIKETNILDDSTVTREIFRQKYENDYRLASNDVLEHKLKSIQNSTMSGTVKANAALQLNAVAAQQDELRNKAYILAHAGDGVGLARQRKLGESLDAEVAKLDAVPGSNHEDNVRATYDSARGKEYRQLGGRAPDSIETETALRQAAISKIRTRASQIANGGSEGGGDAVSPEAALKQAEDEVSKDPKYTSIFSPTKVGSVVPIKPSPEEKDLDVTDSDTGEVRKAISKDMANTYAHSAIAFSAINKKIDQMETLKQKEQNGGDLSLDDRQAYNGLVKDITELQALLVGSARLPSQGNIINTESRLPDYVSGVDQLKALETYRQSVHDTHYAVRDQAFGGKSSSTAKTSTPYKAPGERDPKK